MKKFLLIALILNLSSLFGETLTPKNRVPPKNSSINNNSPAEKSEPVKTGKKKLLFFEPRISILGGTILFNENFFDKRFSSFVFGAELSIALGALNRRTMLYADTGIILSYSKLTLAQPATNFSHTYFFLPIQGRLLYIFNRQIFLEAFAGGLFRVRELDTREDPDGGFRSPTGVSTIEPEGGIGFLYTVSPTFFIQLRASYQFLRAGVEFVL